ncbi:MAG: sigma-70 family RNA polymerase sigma factor [Planctomycetota bacterium]
MDERQRAEQVELAVRGDADALQRLIVYYHAVLRAVVADCLDDAYRARLDPDDVLQDAYTAAFKAMTGCQFDGPAGFYAWLETIALNTLRNHQRASKRHKRNIEREQRPPAAAESSYLGLVHRLAASDTTPSGQFARQEAVAAVTSSLARLTDEQRAVVRLRFLEGRPVAEVAARLGKTEAAVHKLCYRGLKTLHELLVSITRYM